VAHHFFTRRVTRRSTGMDSGYKNAVVSNISFSRRAGKAGLWAGLRLRDMKAVRKGQLVAVPVAMSLYATEHKASHPQSFGRSVSIRNFRLRTMRLNHSSHMAGLCGQLLNGGCQPFEIVKSNHTHPRYNNAALFCCSVCL
jgi:hypothetical protein